MRLNINISKKKIFLLFFNVIFWFSIFFVILKIAKFKINLNLFYDIYWIPFIYSFVFYILSACIRGIRFAYILGSNRYLKSFGILQIYALSRSVFPGGIGEAMLPIYVKKYFKEPFHKGIVLLLTTRVFDILFVILFFICSFFLNGLPMADINITNLSVGLFMILIFSFVFIWVFNKNFRIFLVEKFKKIFNKKKILIPFIDRMVTFISNLDKELTYINSNKKKIITFLTILSRLFIFISFYFLLVSINANVSFIQTIFISTFITLMMIIPLQGVGGFGSYEIWATMALVLIGTSKNYALSLSVLLQLFIFLFGLIEGMIGYLLLVILNKRR
jgi:hypothetical protein